VAENSTHESYFAHHVEIFILSDSRISILDDLLEHLAEGIVVNEYYAPSIAGKINTNLVLPEALALEIRVCTIDRDSIGYHAEDRHICICWIVI
jgi:hypothetical protein